MIYPFNKNKTPHIAKDCFIARSADIIGDVKIGSGSSVWFHATLRADQNYIRIGKNVSIQDNAVIHVDDENPVEIADDVVIGHNAIVHGATVGSNTIIGMGAILLSGSIVGKNCIVAAGAVVTEGNVIPDRSLVAGVPGKILKELSDEHIGRICRNVGIYKRLRKIYKSRSHE